MYIIIVWCPDTKVRTLGCEPIVCLTEDKIICNSLQVRPRPVSPIREFHMRVCSWLSVFGEIKTVLR
jgi:hypothetical protein